MLHRWSACLALLLAPVAAFAQVNDGAKIFTPGTVAKANAIIAETKKATGRDLTVETYDAIPGNKQAAYDAALKADKAAGNRQATKQFYDEWLDERGNALKHGGVFVLIYRSPKGAGHVQVETGRATRDSRDFTEADRTTLAQNLVDAMQAKKYDDGLLAAAEYFRDEVRQNRQTNKPAPAPKPVPEGERFRPAPPAPTRGGWSVGSLICGLLMLFGVIWVVMGIIRAFSNRGRYDPRYGGGGGGPGYGGGYGGGGPGYGGGYGGGGGGFMSGLLGGVFGSVAGNWMYNNMFGGSRHSDPSGGGIFSPPAYGGEPTAPPDDRFEPGGGAGGDFGDTGGAGGAGGDYGGSGGDFGDNAPAGDYGGSGGDFGGDGGGGDFGGSGGDFGGDAGGDFGGSGGDFGGGDDY